ncbi:hypothetical protein, partial [Dysgonomonas sp.]
LSSSFFICHAEERSIWCLFLGPGSFPTVRMTCDSKYFSFFIFSFSFLLLDCFGINPRNDESAQGSLQKNK